MVAATVSALTSVIASSAPCALSADWCSPLAGDVPVTPVVVERAMVLPE